MNKQLSKELKYLATSLLKEHGYKANGDEKGTPKPKTPPKTIKQNPKPKKP